MMAMPTGPGAAGKKFYFFKLVEIESRKFEAKLRSFVRSEDELLKIGEKVEKIVQGAGELFESTPLEKRFVFAIPEENADKFMEAAMQEACIFRF
jgi:hypothetical protein